MVVEYLLSELTNDFHLVKSKVLKNQVLFKNWPALPKLVFYPDQGQQQLFNFTFHFTYVY